MLEKLKKNTSGQAEIREFYPCMDGGSLILYLATVDNSKLEIHFVQKSDLKVSDVHPFPGRLLLNREPVDIRSDLETKILAILKNPTFCFPDKKHSLTGLNLKEYFALILTTLKNFPFYHDTSYRLERLILNECIAFVKSKKYLRLANSNGQKP